MKRLASLLRVSPHFPWLAAVLVALAHVVFAITATTEKSVAFDEVAHIVGGQTYWRHHDFRIQPENGNLPQRLAALPMLLTPWRLPPDDDPSWSRSDIWRLAKRAFYELGNDTDFAVLLARCGLSLHAFGLVLLVFGWSRRAFGLAGGITSLVLCACSPTLLAHGPLATSDVAIAFWMLAATGAYWRFLHAPDWASGALAALCLGCAAVAKFSAPLLAPVWVALWLARAFQTAPIMLGATAWPRSAARATTLFALTLALVVGALGIVWTFYGWRATAFGSSLPAGDYMYSWTEVLRRLGGKAPVFAWLRAVHVLPDAYAYGLANVVAHAQARGAFLNGEVSTTGWVSFFPYAFLVKTPLPLLGALLLALGGGIHALLTRTRSLAAPASATWSLAPLVVLLAVYWTASLTSQLNIGHRHLLPIYPPLFIVAGAAGKLLWQRRTTGRVLLAALLATSIATAMAIRPHYLAYFNLFAGGPAHGYRHLVESSLDWGQDLPGAASWLRQHQRPGEAVHLAYFGMGNPTYEGLAVRRLPWLPVQEIPQPSQLQPGLFMISATMLQQSYSDHGGAWTIGYERLYQALRGLELVAKQWEQDTPDRAARERAYYTDAESIRTWSLYEDLRFARLCHYLRAREPDAHIGYSILVFRVSTRQLASALDGSLSDLANLIESAHAQSLAHD